MTAIRQEAITVAVVFAVLSWATAAFADFAGKVVAVKEGDALEVLTQDKTPIRVRLYGIDCSE